MKAIGIDKPFLPANDFRRVIFLETNDTEINDSPSKQHFVQEQVKPQEYNFVPIDIDAEDILEPPSIREVDYSNFTERVLGYVNEENQVFIGTLRELEPKMIDLLYNSDDLLPMAKLKISKKFQLNGLTKKLELDSLKYLKSQNINAVIANSDDNSITVNNISKLSNPVFNSLEMYSDLIENHHEVKWHDALEYGDNYSQIKVAKLKSKLDDFFDLINNDKKFDSLKNAIIRHSNSFISYNSEHKYSQNYMNTEIADLSTKEESLTKIVNEIKDRKDVD